MSWRDHAFSRIYIWTLQWRHAGHDGVSNHQTYDHLFSRLFRSRSKKTSKLRVTGFCAGIHRWPVNSPHKWPITRIMFPGDDVIMDIWNGTSCCGRQGWNRQMTIWWIELFLAKPSCPPCIYLIICPQRRRWLQTNFPSLSISVPFGCQILAAEIYAAYSWHKHIKAWTKLLPFNRRHIVLHFLELI